MTLYEKLRLHGEAVDRLVCRRREILDEAETGFHRALRIVLCEDQAYRISECYRLMKVWGGFPPWLMLNMRV